MYQKIIIVGNLGSDPELRRTPDGTPVTLTKDDADRFWAKVDRRGPNECWEWKEYRDRDGYGAFNLGGRPYGSHRISLLLATGAIPDGMLACHKCHNPACVNPRHLYWGTPADNVRDMIEAGRERYLFGEDNPCSRLSWDEVRRIRDDYARGVLSQAKMGEEYGLSQRAISKVVRNETWASDDYSMPEHISGHRGVKNSNAKLTWDTVRQIRRLRKNTDLTLDDLAARFGVGNSAIQKIVYGYTWREQF